MKLKNVNIDKILLYLTLGVFLLVLISQIGLKIPFLKGFFTDIEVFEGKAVNENGNVVNSGVITLTMLSGEVGNEYEIYVNGEKVDVFDTDEKKIELLSTSVVEILSTTKKTAEIEISDITSNLTLVTSEKNIIINPGINMVARINLKS